MCVKVYLELYICVFVVGGQIVDFIMVGQIGGLFVDDGQILFVVDFEYFVFLLCVFLLVVDGVGEFVEVDFGVEICGELVIM